MYEALARPNGSAALWLVFGPTADRPHILLPLAPDDQPPPQAAQVDKRLEQPLKIEKL